VVERRGFIGNWDARPMRTIAATGTPTNMRAPRNPGSKDSNIAASILFRSDLLSVLSIAVRINVHNAESGTIHADLSHLP